MSQVLMEKLGYIFKDESLLKIALTHRSRGGEHNERLEFLGDAVVNFMIGDILFRHFPKASEGDLSRWRSSLVNRNALAELAKQFDLGPYLLLGPGEQRSGGNERHSILSCAMEAIIGAIYLDTGFDATYECVQAWYQPWVQSLSSAASHKDPKTVLQEFVQGRRLSLPVYTVESIDGEAHQQFFTVSCQIDGIAHKSYGKGSSRRRAEQEAAQIMLEMIHAS